ncbi:hypothetical protein KZC51_14150 [Microbacterium sp. SSW1-49]|uniref:Uncharacterized protein n=1 Tax=Microbacterium croceum TaxID=2851645 RepID=A0ABT0FGT5_9MICO|nr:hypothetical protein [Microbacterium croceum]MCK2037272.1 hypothetical protein [Microbacterium croceum]
MTTDAAAPRTRRRLVLAGLATTTAGVGLLAHRSIDGIVGDVVGDALYAVLVDGCRELPETPQGALPKESALREEVLTQPTSER